MPEDYPTAEETLWRIWDILKMWDEDDKWSSNEIASVAHVMLRWTRSHSVLPPPEYRSEDEEYYDLDAERDEYFTAKNEENNP